jgi:hypothetical protein
MGGLVGRASAADLTPEAGRRSRRLLAVAEAKLVAVAAAAVRALLDRAAPDLDDPLARARAKPPQGRILVTAGELGEAPAAPLYQRDSGAAEVKRKPSS